MAFDSVGACDLCIALCEVMTLATDSCNINMIYLSPQHVSWAIVLLPQIQDER